MKEDCQTRLFIYFVYCAGSNPPRDCNLLPALRTKEVATSLSK